MKNIFFYILLSISLITISCKKYLDKVPSKALAVPSTLAGLQGLLDNNRMTSNYPQLGDAGSDDYYLIPSIWQSASIVPKNAYIWAADIFQGQTIGEWPQCYNNIYYANVVLEELNKIQPQTQAEQPTWNSIKGAALFYRAFNFYSLEEIFGQPYKPNSNTSDLGIPLRLHSTLTEKVQRAAVQEAYNQIINDLSQALLLVPAQIPATKNKISKAAVYGLLARVYLTMQDYNKAGLYADSSLQLFNTLIDYNTLNANASRPFPAPPNDFGEIIFQAVEVTYNPIIFSNNSYVDTLLFRSYSDNDLRKSVFFGRNANGSNFYKGQYSGSLQQFCGLATDEMYLIRAESFARAGDVTKAMNDLNTLLIKRWKKDPVTNLTTYVNQTATDIDDALSRILPERRKELIYRGLRWIDLRRLNQDPGFAKTLTRLINNQTYTLQPNDPKYAYPIPQDEIVLEGLVQNPRQ